jgi:predicted dehydrogenase
MRKNETPENHVIRAGIAGIGFMGWIHWLAYQRSGQATAAAICSRDPKKRSGDWTGIQGNFGPPGEQVDLGNVACYETLDELLADDTINLIDICLPPHLHRDAACRALAAGKHVFCEKPLALTAADCDAIVQSAEDAGKLLLVGHVLPWFAEYATAIDLINSGQYGAALGGTFKRVISDPQWIPDFFNPATVGGPLVDLHVHDAHLIRYLFGMPRRVHSVGRLRGQVVEYCNTLMEFDDPRIVVAATSGVVGQQGRPFTHGFEIHLEQATLIYEQAVVGGEGRLLMPLTILGPDGQATPVELPESDEISPFVNEIDAAARGVAANRPSELLGGDLARDAIVLCHKQSESAQRGAVVEV